MRERDALLMGSGEPALVPEWYRAGKGARTPNANSDDNGGGLPLRNRVPLIPCDLDSKRTSRRNGSVRGDKITSSAARAYSNFGRRDRKKNLDSGGRDRDRDWPLSADIGSWDYRDSGVGGRTDRDRPWRLERDSKEGVLHRENATGGGIRRPSPFKSEFPTLAAVQKKGVLDTGRISSAVQSLPLPSSTALVGDGWTSALAQVPSSVQTALACPVSLAASNSNGLNMAEALTQASSRARTASQLPPDTSRADELVLRQCKQLIPVTPSMPKSSGLNSSDKSKVRGASRMGDFGGPPKSHQQLSSQLFVVNHALPAAAARSDVPKASQIGNFQVLSRERTGVISPTAPKDVGVQDIVLKGSNPNIKDESKGTSTTLMSSSKMSLVSFGEKRPISLAQNRNDFFNSLRKKTPVNHSDATTASELNCCNAMVQSLPLDQDCGDTMVMTLPSDQNLESCADFSVMNNREEDHGYEYCSDASVINQQETPPDSGVRCGDGVDAFYVETQLHKPQSPSDDGENKQSSCSDCNCHQVADLDEREKAFLQKLGWKEEDATEEALTDKEIADFIVLYQKLRPYSKFSERLAARKLLHVPSLSVAQTS